MNQNLLLYRSLYYNVKKYMIKSHLKCPSCQAMFGFENTPKILKNCQHTICINCLKTLKSCPLDSIQINTNKCGIKSFLTNTQILQEIQNEDTFVPSKNYNQRFSFGYKQNIIPILEYKNSEKLSQWKICNIHFQKANYICKNEAKFICNACISTNEHNLCDIMEYGELTKVMTSFTDQTYKIFEKIKEKSQNLTKSKLYQKILSQITKKKDKQIFNIKSFFQKLFQKLRKQQKILLQKLQNEAKQSIQSLKQTIKLRQSEIKNQDYRIEVHKLTSVMTQVYEYEGIQRALLYLNQSCQESQLIEKGRDLLQDLIHIDQGIKQKINLVGKRLQYCLDDKITESVQKIYSQKEPEKVIKSYQNIQTQVSKSLNFYLAYNFSVCQKLKNDISSLPFQTQISSEQLSQFKDQDFLLQSMNDIERNQGLTKNQITFQEHFSLIVPQSFQEEQFTPILRKEQDSMTVTDQTTITNIRNNQNYPFIQTQSSELTVIKRSHRQNSLIQNFMKSETTELEKTQIKDRTRSPLTPIRNGSHSKFRKNDIPQKYLPVWQAAKQDRCQNIDLTGAELGDTLILHLGSYLKDSKKIRFIKLIRNKLTDEIIFDLINCINQTNIISINLSQNSLTQKSLDVLENMNLGNLKSITLSQNKIVLRKVKDRIQRFKQKGITLTV